MNDNWLATIPPEIKDCVSEAMHEIAAAHPEWAQDQRIAVALSKCGQAKDVLGKALTSVKALNEDGTRVGGYLVLWGDPMHKDLQGEYFTPETDLGLQEYDHYPVNLRVMYHHALDEVMKYQRIGTIDTLRPDEVGVWAEAQLNMHDEYMRMVKDLIDKGVLAWSSGALPQAVQKGVDGFIKTWPIIEGSLTPAPAEPRGTDVQSLKYVYNEKWELTSPRNDPPVKEPVSATEPPVKSDGMVSIEIEVCHPGEESDAEDTPINQEEPVMDLQATIQAVLTALMQARPDITLTPDEQAQIAQTVMSALQPPAQAAPDGSQASIPMPEMKTIVTECLKAYDGLQQARQAQAAAVSADALKTVNELFGNLQPQSAVSPLTQPRRGNASVQLEQKYWGKSIDDLAFAHGVMKGRGQTPSERFVQVMAGVATEAYNRNDAVMHEMTVKSLLPGASAIKANEIATSTYAGGADEWVGILWSNTIWEVARHNVIYDQLVAKGMMTVEVPQGHESVYIPTEGADPTVYTIAQPTDLDATNRPTVNVKTTLIGSGRVLLTPGELGMAVAYTDVLEEDSIVSVSTQYNKQMKLKANETIEQLFLNGDTETSTTNINYDDGTPGTGLSTPYYIASNGARKYALVTGSGTSRSGGALDEDDYRLTLKLFPAAVRARKSEMVFVVDPDTMNTSLSIPAIKTDDVRRTNATVTSGVLTNIWGVDVAESGFMPLTASDGKVTYNAAGTLGNILGVYAPYWAIGNKRKITVETFRDPLTSTNVIVAKMRIGFMPRGAGCAVISYNLTIA